MKKKRNFLKIISSISSCLAICGIFCCSIIFRSDKKTTSALATGGMPDNQIADISNYNVLGNFTGKFDFNWSYLTYNYESFDNYNSKSNDFIPYAQKLNYISDVTPTTMKGLVWIAKDDDFYSPISAEVYASALLYDTVNSTPTFTRCLRLVCNGYRLAFGYRSGPNMVYVDITDTNNYGVYNYAYQRIMIFEDDWNSYPSGSDYRQDFIQVLWDNGYFYRFYEVQDLHLDEGRAKDYIDLLVSDYNTLLESYDSLEDYYANHYIVNVNSHYELRYNLYWNSANTSDFYIKPLNIRCITDIDVSNSNGNTIGLSHGLVDELSLSNDYYYNSTQLLTFLCLDVDVDDNRLLIKYYTGDSSSFGKFYLTHSNNYLYDYQFDTIYDISFTGSTWFRDQVIYYKDIVAGLDDFSNGAYQTGYDDGYASGYTNGNNVGYANGMSEGYQEGLETNGTVVSIFSGILQVAMIPINFFLAVFNFEILGINISAFIQATLTIMVTIIVLRTIFGGKGGSES